ncbi:MAG: alpha/beta hydrolase [Halothiobacillaceae bacterium]|nr:alpha/beta hydrolase [Halothiobacillaceae bacterium]
MFLNHWQLGLKHLLASVLMSLSALALAPLHAEEVTTKLDNLTLRGNLELASGKSVKDGVVLITHGTLAHNNMELVKSMQSGLQAKGYNTLAINLSLGLDKRVSSMYDCPTPHVHKHTDAVGEIAAWTTWLKDKGATRIALMGHSRGGNQTAWALAEKDDAAITAAILVAPQTWEAGYHLKDYKERYKTDLAPLLAKAEKLVAEGKGDTLMDMDFIYCEKTRAAAKSVVSYYKDDARMDTPTLLAQSKKPVLVIIGSVDSTVKGLPEKMAKVADGKRIKAYTVEGADHFFMDLFMDEVVEQTAAFLNWK